MCWATRRLCHTGTQLGPGSNGQAVGLASSTGRGAALPAHCSKMSAGPGHHTEDDVSIRPGTGGGGAGPPSPCAETDTRPAVVAREEQARVVTAGQELLRHLPPELRHPLGPPGMTGPRVQLDTGDGSW
ncbi:UNVERIFIED_CONTAM: hypothetical protein K2H54_044964 [Gekko kuhli]